MQSEHWLRILLSLANGQNEAGCHGSVTNPVRSSDTFLEFALKTSFISLADNMKRTVMFLSRNRFTDDHAAASLASAPLYDNGQFLRKTWHPSEKNSSTLQRAFLPLLGGTGKKRSACRHDRRFQKAAVIRLCPNNPLCFPAITGRCRPLRPAAARAGRTPDRVRPAAARSRRDSAAWHPLLCGWTAPRKTVF